jgi:pimeloyl-ACP methyl ester carboxylesterase
MQLNYKRLGEGKPLIILHGLFGSLDNWVTLAKQFATQYEVFLVDQRNHGRSPHSADFNYSLMADDLKEFIETHQIQNPMLLGHSMGGKAVMQFAVKYPSSFDKMIVVDISPRAYPVHHYQIFEGLNSLNLAEFKSRTEADQALAKHIEGFGVRQFLLKNMYRTKEKTFAWRMNLPVLEKTIELIAEEITYQDPILNPVLFVRGTKSFYLGEEDAILTKQLFPNSTMVNIDAGHWIHAEKPQELLKEITGFLA